MQGLTYTILCLKIKIYLWVHLFMPHLPAQRFKTAVKKYQMQHSVFQLTSMEKKEAFLKKCFPGSLFWPTLGILCNVHVQEIATVGRSWVMWCQLSPRRGTWTSRQIVAEPPAKWDHEMGMSIPENVCFLVLQYNLGRWKIVSLQIQ